MVRGAQLGRFSRRIGVAVVATAGIGLAGATEASADYPSTVLSDNPSAYYRLDETGNATTMLNQVSGGANGTHELEPVQGLPGALVYESPNLAIAYTTADGDRSRFPSGGSYTQFSLEFWMYTAMANFPPSVTQWYSGAGLVDGEISGENNDAGTALIRDGLVGFGMGNPDRTIASTTDVADNVWHHVVATADGTGNMKLYVDGALETQIANGPTGSRSNANFSIGALDTTHQPYSGGLDEVAFYRHVLSAGDVAEHYDAAVAPEVTVLVRDYIFGGEGTVSAPEFGIDCGPATDACDTIVPLDTQIQFTAVPAAGSRFSGWDDDSGCEPLTAPTCNFAADNPGFNDIMVLGSNFYFTGKTLAEGLVDSTAASAVRVENALDDSVQPRNVNGINPSNVPLTGLPSLNPGQSGGALAFLVPNNQVSLVGSDGASLVGRNGPAFTPKAADPVPLIGSDGGTLLGSDGGSLIGSDGASLLGSDGGTRRAARAACPANVSRSGRLYVLGRYKKQLTSAGATTSTFKLTNEGKDVIATFGRMNLELKRRGMPLAAMPATYLQAIQPADEGRSGVVYDTMCIQK